MHSILLTVFLLANAFPVFAQQSLKVTGRVVIQNSKYLTGQEKTISGATIKAGLIDGKSDANGKFSLDFPEAPYGGVSMLQAKKSGFELINSEELKQAAISRDAAPIRVVMCSKEQLYASQSIYTKAIEESYLNAYKDKRAILENPGTARAKFLADMRVNLNRKIQDEKEAISLLEARLRFSKKSKAKELSGQLLVINLDEQSEVYQRAFRVFVEDRSIAAAIGILDKVDLAGNLKKNEASLKTAGSKEGSLKEEIRKDTRLAIFRARLHKLNDEFQKADSAFALALRYDPTNFELIEEYSGFLLEESQDFRAQKIYDKLVTYCRRLVTEDPERNLSSLATALNRQGGHAFSQNNYAKARTALEEAFDIRQNLAAKNPHAFGVDASGTAIVLSILQYQLLESSDDNKHYIKGIQYLNSAYEFLDTYAEATPEIVIYMRAIDEYRSKYQALSPEEEDRKRRLLEQEAAVRAEDEPVKKVLKQKELIRLQTTYAGEGEMSIALKAAIGNEYGSLSWFQLFAKDFSDAESSARKGMVMAPREDWIVNNLAAALLYQGKWEEAKAIYLEFKDKRYKGSTYGQSFLNDLAELEAAGIIHSDVEKARALLK